jgi:hypothetical protein
VRLIESPDRIISDCIRAAVTSQSRIVTSKHQIKRLPSS